MPGFPIKTNPGSFGAFLAKHGITQWPQLEAKLPAGAATAKLLNNRPTAVPPNSPVLGPIAAALHVMTPDVAAFAKGKPMTEMKLRATEAMLKTNKEPRQRRRRRRPGQRTAAKSAKVLASVAVARPNRRNGKNGTHASANGNGMSPLHGRRRVGKPKGATTNRLRRGALEVREVARLFVNTLNLAISNGERETPPIPVPELYALLSDYLATKGIRVTVLLDPRFTEAFDL